MQKAILILLAALFTIAPNVGAAEQNLLYFSSSPGDYIGQGQTFLTTDPATFSVGGTREGLSVSTPWGYGMSFVPPAGQQLRVANFTDAHRTPFRGAAAGIEITGNGRGCNQITGAFDIREIEFGGDGNVSRLWMYYEQFCENTMPPIRGEIRFRSLQAPELVPRIIRVPSEFSTIQAAVNAVGLGDDVIVVAPGVYRELVILNGRRMTIRGEGGPSQTFLEPPADRAGFTISNAESPTSVRIEGFTVINCQIGFNINGASPTISGNVISNCAFGIQAFRSSAVIQENQITRSSTVGINLSQGFFPIVRNNVITECAAGIGLGGGEPTFHQNIIANNTGPGINIAGDADPILTQNIIYSNGGSGVAWQTPAGRRGSTLVHNTIIGNPQGNIPAVRGGGYTSGSLLVNNIIVGAPALDLSVSGAGPMPPVAYNLFYSPAGPVVIGSNPGLVNTANNRVGDPQFLDPQFGGFELLATSPAIDAGTDTNTLAADFLGTVRPVEGNATPPAAPDIGAFEFIPGPPRAPRSLTVVAGPDDVALSWRAFDLATSYVVSRGTSPDGPFQELAVVNGLEYRDATVQRDVIYYYVIAGRNNTGVGANSAPVSARAGNFPPTAVPDVVEVLEDTPTDIQPLANDTDANNDPLTITALLAPVPAGVTLGAANTINYAPPLNVSGINLTINYRITDGRGAFSDSRVEVTVLPVNDTPLPTPVSFQATANTNNVVTIPVADPDSTEFELLVEQAPAHGMLVVGPGNSFEYLPTWGYAGLDAATFRVTDGQAESGPVQVSFNVRAPRDFDADGMSDAWENFWDLNNPLSDLDLDGVPNLNEYLAFTSPRDGNSALQIEAIARTPDGFIAVVWPGVGGVRYRIYSTDSLSSPFQAVLRSASTEIDSSEYGAPSEQIFIDPRPLGATGMRFYRIQTVR